MDVLRKLPQDLPVYASGDAEGNRFGLVDEVHRNPNFEDDWNDEVLDAVVIWPV